MRPSDDGVSEAGTNGVLDTAGEEFRPCCYELEDSCATLFI